MKPVTISSLQARKAAGEKFAVIAAYDATFSKLIDDAGVEVILVGDSLGMVLQGHDSTLPVTIDDMAYHTSCVKRGSNTAMIIADMPYGDYNHLHQTLDNASKLMAAGAHMVKLEGGRWLYDTISALAERGTPVCAHLGLTPQSVNAFGGFKVQGRDPENTRRIIEEAKGIEAAGASLLVLECIPAPLAAEITRQLSIPVIGIGAGPETDAQVLVLHDMLGLSSHCPRFVHNFLADHSSVQEALKAYNAAVKDGTFPAEHHTFQ